MSLRSAFDSTPRHWTSFQSAIQIGRLLFIASHGLCRLQCRYDRPHSLDDLEKCIRPYTEALELHSAGHPESVSALHNLAWALRRRYVRFRSLSDLEASIQLYTEASELRPADHLGIMALHMHMLLTCYVIDHVPWMTSRGAFDFIPRRWNFTLTTIRTVACVENT